MNELLGTDDEPMGGWEKLFWIFVGTIFAGVAALGLLFFILSKKNCSEGANAVHQLFRESNGDLHLARSKGFISDEAADSLFQITSRKTGLRLNQIVSETSSGLEGGCSVDVILASDRRAYHVGLEVDAQRIWSAIKK